MQHPIWYVIEKSGLNIALTAATKGLLSYEDSMRSLKSIYFIASIFLTACAGQKSITTLPDHKVIGYQPSSFSLFVSTKKQATTAMGQVFMPPDGHAYLTDVGFALINQPYRGEAPQDVKVKLRISAWGDSKPINPPEWESEAMPVSGNITLEWIRFKVPHLRLIPGQKYIAWLSLTGLNNPQNASIAVINMGPTTPYTGSTTNRKVLTYSGESLQANSWNYDYLEGFSAFWRNPNPHGSLSEMEMGAWQVEKPGHNLRFEMSFENMP